MLSVEEESYSSTTDTDDEFDEEVNEEEELEEENFATISRYSCHDVLEKLQEIEKKKMEELNSIIDLNDEELLKPKEEMIEIKNEVVEETSKEMEAPRFKFKGSWECPVCLEDIVQPFLFNCGRIYCFTCCEEYIKSRINSGHVITIKCMDPACNHVLNEFEIMSILTPNDFTKYRRTYAFATHRRRGEVWCPQVDCPGKGNVISGKFAQCKICKFEFCMKCFTPAHPSMSCSASKRRTRKILKKQMLGEENKLVISDRKSKRWATKNTKKCPCCYEVIQKNGGCHHVFCTSCGTTFCWYCKQESTSYKHCKKRKFAFIGGSILLSPVIVAGALIVGPPLAIAGGIVHIVQKEGMGTPSTETYPYRTFYSARETLGLKIYWLLD